MIYLDSEFFGTKEKYVTPVCAATYDSSTGETYKWWTLNSPNTQKKLAAYLLSKKKETFFAWAAIAEGRYLLSLGLDPVKFKWFDGFLEYRCLTNSNDRLCYGPQLVNGQVKNTRKPPPKWERTEEDSANSFKPTHSLAEATFKLTGNIRDTEHKNKMRDIIISGDEALILAHKQDILDYCFEDTVFLPNLHERIIEEYMELLNHSGGNLSEEILERGKYSALTAKMESVGYPVNVEKTRNFASSVLPILDDCQREINELFPDVKPFRFDKKEGKFKWNQKGTREWLAKNVDTSRWMKTDGYKKALKNAPKGVKIDVTHYLSLSLEAFQKVFDFKHDYPKDNFGAQIVRYLKLKQNLNGFVPSKGKKSFWDFVGSDGRVRPYFNIFGAQSSRSQPGSTGYLFLKPAWMRSLCEPKPGRAIAAFDYGSEEFLVSALVANDRAMIKAYESGDIYLAFAKATGAVPPEGTKETHKRERNLAKSTVLGVSYLMTAIGLSAKLTSDTGILVTEEQAQELIDAFYESYPDFAQWQNDLLVNYFDYEEPIKLKSGWYLWKDKDRQDFRSVANAPIQGFGADIMRKAVEFCDEHGLEVILTLHDALYIEYDSHDFEKIDLLHDAMRRGFTHYFDNKKDASVIRLDGFTWSPDYEKDSSITTPGGLEIACSDIYVDERAESEYEQFKQYFEDRSENYL